MIKNGEKYMLVTFDTESNIGSWTQDYSSIDVAIPSILEILEKRNTKATFLWEGMAALHNPDMAEHVFLKRHE